MKTQHIKMCSMTKTMLRKKCIALTADIQRLKGLSLMIYISTLRSQKINQIKFKVERK